MDTDDPSPGRTRYSSQLASAKRVFDRLMHLPAERWRARLDRLALDPDVRTLVLRLFEARDRPAGILDTLPWVSVGASPVGRRLGAWVLEAEIGRGGSSVVYRARSADGERQVAIKVLTLAALAGSGAERFLQEQRILARLNHPHIAQLFDVGRESDGTLWYAMALVHGVPIDEWCRRRQLAPRAIVTLFLDLCDAVAYAHRSLVIHRDIKPSNVLVDEHGHLRLLDFGTSRYLDGASTATETSLRMLTPQYAAPEQFEAALPSTAMDVYGLGALLYRLLCGRAPRERTDPPSRPPVEPSRLMTEGQRHRASNDDLGRVLLKSLAPSPEARYLTVGDLTRDLQRWLRHEPVSVSRPSLFHRARMFVLRNKLAVGAAAAIVLTLVGGVAATTWQASRAQREASRAQDEASRALAVKRFITQMIVGATPNAHGGVTTDIRDALSRAAAQARADLANTPLLQAELLVLIGRLQSAYGQNVPARRQLEDALALTKDQEGIAAIRGAALVQIGQIDREERQFDAALAHLDEAIAELTPLTGDEALETLLGAYESRAFVNETLGRIDLAFADLADAEALEAALVPREPRRRKDLLLMQARLLLSASRPADAATVIAKAEAIGSEQPVDYVLHTLKGHVFEASGRWMDAEAAYRRALDMAEAAYPPDSAIPTQPASYLAILLRRTGRLDEAVHQFQRILERQRRAAPTEDDPSLSVSESNAGISLCDVGRFDEGLPHLRRALAMAESSFGWGHPSTARPLAFIAFAMAQSGDPAEAMQAIGAAAARLRQARDAGVQGASSYSASYVVLARSALLLERPEWALGLLDQAEALASGTVADADPKAILRESLRVEALSAAGRRYEAIQGAWHVLGRMQRLRDDGFLHERAEAQALLTHVLADAGYAHAAARLATAARNRAPGAVFPEYVEREIATLVRTFGPPAP